MSGISAENLARLTSADRQSLADAVEAVLLLADSYERAADERRASRSAGILSRQYRLAVEEKIR